MIHSHLSHNTVLAHHSSANNILVAFFLNLAFTVIAVTGGLLTSSNAILSESVHNLGCTLSLGLAWFFQRLSATPPSEKYPLGYRRFSLLGALINALVIMAGSLIMLFESLGVMSGHEEENVMAEGMLWVAIAGIAFKGAAVLQTRGKGANERMVSLHLLSDMMGWVSVLIVSIVLLIVYLPILDTLLSVMISVYIIVNVIRGLTDVISVLMDRTPRGLDRDAVMGEIRAIKGVYSVTDLKVWSLDGDLSAAVVNAHFEEAIEKKTAKEKIRALLLLYGIETIAIEDV